MRVFTSTRCLDHDQGPDHPESPLRLSTVLATLRASPVVQLTEALPATLDDQLICHDRDYLEHARDLSAAGGGDLGADVHTNGASWAAALAASGAVLAALQHALSGASHAFAAVRPPGHHALAHRAMGFCIVNHVAVAALTARAAGQSRVLIIDWDVHHGNGTQALVDPEPQIRFVSMHQWPWYPGSGSADERGLGNIFNVPMRAALPPAVYLESLWRAIVVATTGWTPDLILLSAGFDSMLGDPLGGFTLEPGHYAEWVSRLRNAFPDAPIMGLMEGGYAPDRLAEGVLATVTALAS